MALHRDDGRFGARRALWLSAGLLVLAVLALLLAGAYPAHAEQPDFPGILPLPNGWAPEGIAIGRGNEFFVSSTSRGAIYKGDLRTGAGAPFAFANPTAPITGLKVDKRTNYVFASGATSGMAFVFDGTTGKQLAAYQLTTLTPSFINDVVITRDAAYFTNSNQPEIYRVPLGPGGRLPDASQIQTIHLSGDYQQVAGFNANGIDATPNGKLLVIVQTATGYLYTVNPQTGVATRIDLGGQTVVNGDGILLQGKTLYVVQNQDNKIAVIRLNLKRNSGTITGYITNPKFDVPTTLARHGESLYAVNARFNTPVTPDTEYWVVRVDRHAGDK